MVATRYPTRSVRIEDMTWNKAKARAESEGVTISRVLSLFVEGYARGMIDLPKMQMVYPKKQD